MGTQEPKQYLCLNGRSLLDWSLGALLAAPALSGCVVALPQSDVAQVRRGQLKDPRVSCCAGGATRADSVMAALAALPAADEDWVLVHDAARPALPLGDVERLIAAVTGSRVGGILARPITDTLKRADAGQRVVATVDRRDLWSAQTPQMFRVGELRAALALAHERAAAVTDEASAMELAGHPVQVVEGSPANLKVTYPADLALAAFWLEQLYGESVSMSTEIA
jgi:2-C-methyl-D-erythritol 4-phosphate cytidylyltransferase